MLKLALRIGVSKEEFENITPHEFELMIEAYKEQQKHANYMMWVNGIYTMSALQASVGNMFKKNNSKPYEYPKKPYDLNEKKELTEEELQKQRELFVAKLQVMKANFELSRKDNSVS